MKKVIIDGDRIRRSKFLSIDNNEARKIVLQKIQDLILKHYDNYRYEPTESDNNYICCIFNRNNQDLMGMMMLLRSEINGVKIGEAGVSLVAEEYRGMGVQSKTGSDVSVEALTYLKAGNPLYATTRSFSAHSQTVMDRVKFPEKNGTHMRVGKARGVAPYYLFSKDSGKFFLEMHMLFESWLPINEMVQKRVYLPPIAKMLDFDIFNTNIRRDVDAIYQIPTASGQNRMKFETFSETVNELSFDDIFLDHACIEPQKCSIINHEDPVHWIDSKDDTFKYSDKSTPDPKHRVIHIEEICDFGFLKELKDETLKSMNITVQISDFEDDETKGSNLILINELLLAGFLPCAVYDVLKYLCKPNLSS